MKVETIYTFTEQEIKDAIYKVKNGRQVNAVDVLALTYGAEKWVDFKEECYADPSYQWGYGHSYK